MNLSELFIKRPVLSIVVSLVIMIAGLQAWRSLNVRQYPRSENSTVVVSTVYVGANADLVRGFVTTPLERAIASADGIDYVESKSLQGFSTISARLKLNYEPTKALAEITSKVNQVRNDLPPEAEVPSISVQSADSQFAAAYLSFASNILNQAEITDYLSRVVQPRLGAVTGVQRADILGARTFAMRIWLKPDRMAALNISPLQVRQESQPPEIRAIAWRAQLRLSHRYRRLTARGLQHNKTCVALARELAGFIWDIGRHVDPSV